MRVHLRLRIGTDAEEFAEGHAQPLVEVMIDPAVGFDPLGAPLQQIQDQWPEVSTDQQSVVLLQEELGQAL